jgi:hypothetical protein
VKHSYVKAQGPWGLGQRPPHLWSRRQDLRSPAKTIETLPQDQYMYRIDIGSVGGSLRSA